MRIRYFHPVILIATYLAISFFSSVNASDSIKWQSYKEGKVLAKIENKKVFMHFYADWCIFCLKMAKETFRDDTVVSYLNKNFISIRVDFDKEPAISQKYGVRGLPANWFLAETGQPIVSIPGFLAPDAMLSLLKEVNEISVAN